MKARLLILLFAGCLPPLAARAETDTGSAHNLIFKYSLDEDWYLSSRNLPGVEVRPWGEASAYDILWSDVVIVEESAFSGDDGDAVEEEEPS